MLRHRPTSLLAACLLGSSAGAQLPPVPEPPGNPRTPDKVLLGKALFWEEQLSATRTVACGTCHFPSAGGSDARASAGGLVTTHPGADATWGTADDVVGSAGVIRNLASGAYQSDALFALQPQVTPRKAPSMIDAAYAPFLFWDGRADRVFVDPAGGAVLLPDDAALESQAAAPPVSVAEMGHVGITWAGVAQRIEDAPPLALATDLPAPLAAFVAGSTYPDLFALAFGTPDVTPARIAMAIAAYERELISDQAKIDGFPVGFTPEELLGATVFDMQGSCATCHPAPLFSDFSFRNIGVTPIADDPGRAAVTGDPFDDGKFKVPSLRNVELRAPFFHDGSAATLEDVVEFYDRGGDFHVNQDFDVFPLGLTQAEKDALVAFLGTFTDARVRDELPPFDRPTLYSESSRAPVLFGAGSPGTGGFVPRAIANEPPWIQNPGLTLGVEGGLGGAPVLLALDFAPSVAGIPVVGIVSHLALSPRLTLFPQGVLQGAGPGAGYTSATFSIDKPPAAIGKRFYFQWIPIDFGAPGGVLSASDAIELTLF